MGSLNPSDWIAIGALGVSFSAAFFARASSSKANDLARENTNIQHGLLELELRQAIDVASAKINDIGLIMVPLKSKSRHATLSSEEQEVLTMYESNLNAAIQAMLNAYDGACSKYLDSKVDKVRFKKSYHFDIRNVVERQALKEYFDPITSRYKPILKVYDEWENHEK